VRTFRWPRLRTLRWPCAEASLLEIISPAGFEKYFEELIDMFPEGKPQPEKIAPIAQRFGLEIDPSTIPALCAEHGLSFG
jgi:hypothetical protein